MKCEECLEGNLILKDEVTYVYHYHIKEDGTVKWNDEEGYAPYIFFNREQMDFKQIIQCDNCHKCYDFEINKGYDTQMVILKKAIHSNNTKDLSFFV